MRILQPPGRVADEWKDSEAFRGTSSLIWTIVGDDNRQIEKDGWKWAHIGALVMRGHRSQVVMIVITVVVVAVTVLVSTVTVVIGILSGHFTGTSKVELATLFAQS